MPDNLGFNPHAGEKYATDDVDGIHHIRVKVQHGADGSATDVSSASPLPVTASGGTVAGATPAIGHTLAGSPPISQTVITEATTYLGVDIRETTGTTSAIVVLYDGTTATGTILGTYSLNPGESRAEEFVVGRRALIGIHAAITGTMQGSVFAST
jgi:hypothetical protein